MHTRSRSKTILDRVHDHVALPPVVVQAIDTPQFQRLRGLKQLGASTYLYPGAVHTRFEHSIGVAHMARSFLSVMQSKQPELSISAKSIENVMLAGLCHDLGHGPFSHLFEDVITERSNSCSVSRGGAQFCHEEMSQRLATIALEPLIGSEDLREVLSLMAGTAATEYPHGTLISNKRNGIDVDRLDYFLRDSLCCFGKPTVDVRVHRLYHTARIIMDPDSGAWHIAFEEKMAIAIRELFALRAKLHKQVYQHHVTKAVGHMIADAFRLAEPHFRVRGATFFECTQSPEAFLALGDWVLDAIEHDSNPKLKDAQSVIQRLRTRDIYKMMFTCTLRNGVKLSSEEITKSIADRIGVRENGDATDNDFIADVVVINHGRGDKDPLQFVSFFNPKRDDPTLSHVAGGSSPLFCPRAFEERTVMIFQRRHTDSVKLAVLDWAKWAANSGLVEPQLPFSNAT